MPTTVSNREIADTFDQVAEYLELKGEIVHRVLAYRRAAESIRNFPRDIRLVAEQGELKTIEHIGDVFQEKITELLETGQLDLLERLRAEIPQGVVEVLRIGGVGPKRAMRFYKELGIASVDDLAAAVKDGRIAKLSGMGAKSAQKILDSIEALARRSTRKRLDEATNIGQAILADLLNVPGVVRGDVGGSIRRGLPTIGDVDLLIATTGNPIDVMQALTQHPLVSKTLSYGDDKTNVELNNGQLCDIRVVPPESYGTLLIHFTGNVDHNIQLRRIAEERGYSLNEYAFVPLNNDVNGGADVLCATEEEVYAFLGLAYIPPELRNGDNEIEAARNRTLPNLITINDIRGDLHMHTVWSDGKLSVRQMAEIARSRGLSYVVITDHSQSLGVANGLTAERLRAQREEIRQADAEMRPFRVFQGVEMEIRADGQMDYPDDVLAELDVVIASLHVGLRQERAQVTQRLLNAIRNPHVDIIGHPRGQLIPDREPADLDMDAVFAAAVEHNTILEINANPHRLDLDAPHARRAIELGITLSIDTDAHSEADFEVLPYGIITARRAWVTAANVINTWTVEQFTAWVESRK
jgi:DNA polymerase (family X)